MIFNSVSLVVTLIMAAVAAAYVISDSHPTSSITSLRNPSSLATDRQAKTLDMNMGMNMVRDMFQNGLPPYRPLAIPPFMSNIKNMFRSNGTHVTWVPLGSLLFANNGKIVGG